jgi:hypothetical protein
MLEFEVAAALLLLLLLVDVVVDDVVVARVVRLLFDLQVVVAVVRASLVPTAEFGLFVSVPLAGTSVVVVVVVVAAAAAAVVVVVVVVGTPSK